MAHIHKQIAVNASPQHVWEAVRDVGAIHERLARGFVAKTRLDGDVREVTFGNGAVVSERILDIDENARRVTYSIVEGRPTAHTASIQVAGDGSGNSTIVWLTDVLPDDLAALFDGMMDQGCAAMKATLESD